MKFQYTFQKMEPSEFVVKAAEEKITHTTRYLLKDGSGHIYFGRKGFMFSIKVSIQVGGEGYFKASAESENLYSAIDLVCDKLEKQFVKKKDKIQNHKKYNFSRQGKLHIMNETLDHNFNMWSKSLKKSG